jgi:hypothetical protein
MRRSAWIRRAISSRVFSARRSLVSVVMKMA